MLIGDLGSSHDASSIAKSQVIESDGFLVMVVAIQLCFAGTSTRR
jgi:hypothetical protein